MKNDRLKDWLCAAGAVGVGIFAGAVDFNNDEPQAACAVLLVLGGGLGFLRTRGAWRWGVIAALGIPAVYLVSLRLGFKPKMPPQPNLWATLLALIPSTVGVYMGVFCRKILTPQNDK